IGTSQTEYTGNVTDFDNLVVTANYTGPDVGDGFSRTTLVIDSVRIWASNGIQSNYVYWFETTLGNFSRQENQPLYEAAPYLTLSDYQNIVWNPGERAVEGTSSTRTFDLSGSSIHEIRIDGIEVFGHIEYTYTPGAEGSTFSIGLGKTSGTGAWTTNETASANIDVTGPFSLDVAASCSGFYGSSGTTFENRVLGMGATGIQYVGNVTGFDDLEVTASYTGPDVGDGVSKTTLVIDSVRIWASNGIQSNYVYWLETTPGNFSRQENQPLYEAASYLTLSDYQNIVWNPGDLSVGGTSSTRTFDLSGSSVHEIRIDGIEVFGHVEYTYDPTITGSTFNVGLGYNALDGTEGWDDAETSNSNTHVTGDFALAVSVTSPLWSSSGATFADRVLGAGASGTEYTARSRNDERLEVTVTADYTGSLAGYGSTPMTLVIDSISIHAGNFTSQYPNEDIRWQETTPGNTNNSPWLDLGIGGTHASGANYDRLQWNPGEVAVAGTNTTRTFVLDGTGGLNAYCDGVDIVGHVEYRIASPIPEIGDIAIEFLPANDVVITWSTADGFSYTLEKRSDLTGGGWSPDVSGVSGTGGDVSITTPVFQAEAFYRVVGDE
ncbi:MAG: hypothetical protein ABFR33_09765, partial [Verrucomicrobiota bacterium]